MIFVVELTSNYLRLILAYLSTNEENGGVLIHCISGWDRTPLYVSLIRMSLWADGVIHQNLNALEMLYLTINYDWFLFSHYLQDRCERGEDIFYFCFFFLSYMTDDSFSISSVAENVRLQQHASSHKISIRSTDDHDDDNSDGTVSSSFGSCGRSWEFTSGYLNQYGKSRPSNGCLYLDDSAMNFPNVENVDSLTDKSISSIKDDVSHSDDALFSFDDGEEEFCVLRSSSDDLPEEEVANIISKSNGKKSSEKKNKNDSTGSSRATRLQEISSLMKPLYSAFVAGTL